MNYEEIMEILKEYGRHTRYVWLSNSIENKAVMLKYDTTRRYFMSQIRPWREFERESNLMVSDDGKHCYFVDTWKSSPSLQRVPQDVFKSNVEWLLENGYTISF